MQAACLGIYSLDRAPRTAHKERAIQNNRSRKGRDVSRKTKGPFQLEVPDLFQSQAGLLGRLVTRVRTRGTPAVPFLRCRVGQGTHPSRAETAGGSWSLFTLR